MADNHFKVRRGVSLDPQSSPPNNPLNGDMYYDSSLERFRKYENGAWTNFSDGGGFDADVILVNATGDILVNSDGNVLIKV